MTDAPHTPADAELIEHARAAGWHEPEKAPEFLAAYRAHVEAQPAPVLSGIAAAVAALPANQPCVHESWDVTGEHKTPAGWVKTRKCNDCPTALAPIVEAEPHWDIQPADAAEPEPFARVMLRLGDTDDEITVEADSSGMNPAAVAFGLRNAADEFDNRARAQGIEPMPDRADHAVRLYAKAAIERDDFRTEAATLRARVAELEQRDAWLTILEAAGVDSWSGMEHAISMRNAEDQDDDADDDDQDDEDDDGPCDGYTDDDQAEPEQPAMPAVGDRYVKRDEPDAGRIVTVSRVWNPPAQDQPAIAYDWTDDKPGQCGSACRLDMFRRAYRAEAGR